MNKNIIIYKYLTCWLTNRTSLNCQCQSKVTKPHPPNANHKLLKDEFNNHRISQLHDSSTVSKNNIFLHLFFEQGVILYTTWKEIRLDTTRISQQNQGPTTNECACAADIFTHKLKLYCIQTDITKLTKNRFIDLYSYAASQLLHGERKKYL